MAAFRYIVHDVDVAAKFYVERLGFTIAEKWGPAVVIVRRGDMDLWLSGPRASASQPMPDGRKPTPGSGWNRAVVLVEDLDALVNDLRAAGVIFRNEVIKGPAGWQVLVDDPSGNCVELFEVK